MKEIAQAYAKRLVLLGVLLATPLLLILVAPGVASAHAAYSCTNPHCYAEQDWFGPDGGYLTGSNTDITIGHITCSSCNGVASVETWLVDNTSAQAFKCGNLVCWIEAGYAEKPISTSCGPAGTECYFCGDHPPNSGLYYWPYSITSYNYV